MSWVNSRTNYCFFQFKEITVEIIGNFSSHSAHRSGPNGFVLNEIASAIGRDQHCYRRATATFVYFRNRFQSLIAFAFLTPGHCVPPENLSSVSIVNKATQIERSRFLVLEKSVVHLLPFGHFAALFWTQLKTAKWTELKINKFLLSARRHENINSAQNDDEDDGNGNSARVRATPRRNVRQLNDVVLIERLNSRFPSLFDRRSRREIK